MMIIYRDASYLSELKAHIRSSEKFFLGYQNFKKVRETNGSIHTVSNKIKM